MADKRCDNGHFIDESWDLCPYCPVDEAEPEIPVVRPARLSPPEPRPEPVRPTTAARPATNPDPERRRPSSGPPPAPVRRENAPVGSPPMERTVAVPKFGSNAVDAVTKRYVVGWLVGLNGQVRGESYPVRIGRNILGRDRRSDICVNDEQASSHHADLVFRPEERRFILMDHNSTNGTYVNEVEIEPRRDLAENDVVRIGSHKFLFMPLCHEGFYWDDEGALQ